MFFINQYIKDNPKAFKSFVNLSAVQVLQLIIPIITYPYLLTVIGKEKLGLIIFAQVIMFYLVIISELGLNVSSVKLAIKSFRNKDRERQLYASVFFIKLSMMLILLALLYFYGVFFSIDNTFKYVLYISFLLVIAEIFNPIWYFQAKHLTHYVAFTNLIAKIIYVTCILAFVRTESDFLRVPLFWGAVTVAANFILYYILVRRVGEMFFIPQIKYVFFVIKFTRYIFYFRLIGAIKSGGNKVILGTLGLLDMLVYYDLAEKIVDIANRFSQSFSVALMPQFVSNRDRNFAKKSLLAISLCSVVGYIVFSILVYPAVFFIDINYIDVAYLFWVLGLLIPIYAVAIFVGNSVLVANGHDNLHFWGSCYSTILYVVLISIILFFFNFNTLILAFVVVVSQAFAMLLKFNYAKKLKLL